jgi:preprotein translocase subunit SecG
VGASFPTGEQIATATFLFDTMTQFLFVIAVFFLGLLIYFASIRRSRVS